MKERYFIGLLLGSMGVGIVGTTVSLFIFDPDNHIWWQVLLIYLGLFLVIFSVIALLNYRGKMWWTKNQQVYVSQRECARQAFLLALCANGLLALQAFRVLSWWNGIAFIGIILVAELYFMSRR